MRELDKGAMFPKDNIAGDTKTMRDKIITPIPLLSFAIAKKNKALTEAQVYYAYMAEEERNKQNQRSEGGDNLEVTQKGTHMEFDYG